MKSKSKKNGEERNKKIEQNTTNDKNRNREKELHSESMPNLKVILLCAVCCGIAHMFYLSSIFEKKLQFSDLSNIEREMTCQGEMGLYYSYYKDIVEASSFMSGFNSLLYNNKTEYPRTINTVQRFNLYPELFLGGMYRIFSSTMQRFQLKLPKECWNVFRRRGLEPVLSCEGIGDPFYWYLNGVWISAGMTVALLFIHGCQLSYSLTGGFLVVSCFFFNHGEANSVQWTPFRRENFAFPWSIAINIIATCALRRNNKTWHVPFAYGMCSAKYLLFWKLSQYTLICHIVISYIMYTTKMIGVFPMLVLLIGSLYAFLNNVALQFGNGILFASPLAAVLVGILLLYIFIEPIIQHFPFPMDIAMQLSCVFIASVAAKLEISRIFSVEDELHIVNMVRSKISNYSDFHTLLYQCSPEYEFLSYGSLYKLTETLLLPCVILMVGCVLSNTFGLMRDNFAKRLREKNRFTRIWEGIDCGVIYNIMLLGAYTIIACTVVQLKPFFVTQLCVMASLLASRRYWKHILSRKVQTGALVCFVAAMAMQGSRNVLEERSAIGEYNNPKLEELIDWVSRETGRNAVFGGPMSTMASLLLSTGRPIVNHPQYDNAALRERTKGVYSVFSRRSSDQVYETLVSLKVNYVVLKGSWCFNRKKNGCGVVEVWDIEEPENKEKPSLCSKLFKNTPSPFHKVFLNEEYLVLEVPSKYIEIPAPRILSE